MKKHFQVPNSNGEDEHYKHGRARERSRAVEAMAPYLFTLVSLMVGGGGYILYLYAPFWRVRHVPGPPTVPFLGHLHLIAKAGPHIFTVLAKKYGPIFRYFLFSS